MVSISVSDARHDMMGADGGAAARARSPRDGIENWMFQRIRGTRRGQVVPGEAINGAEREEGELQ